MKYQPASDRPGIYTFTYQAADPQGSTSQWTTRHGRGHATRATPPPDANPDSIRLPVGVAGDVAVLANDVDPDGDELTITDVDRA